MSLILKQEPAASIPNPPAGKGALFVNDSAALSVKSPDGSVAIFATASGSNTQIYFNDSSTINGNSNLTFTKTTGTLATFALTVTSNSNVGNLGTAGLIVATGNVTGGNLTTAGRLVSSIATGTAPLTITSTTRVANLNVDYANVSDFISVAAGTGNNFIIFANAATGNITELTSTGLIANLSNNSITATTFVGALSGAATSATTAGTVTTAAQPNITSTGTLTSLIVGNATANTTFGNGIFTATGNANVGNLGTAGLIVATGNVTGGNLTTGGQLSVTGIGTIGGVVLPTWNLGGTDISTVGGGSAATGRTLLGWNRSSGGGEFSIITNRNGGGTGGVKFYEWANTLSNTTTEIFSVTAAGAVTTPSTIVATGNVTGGNLVTGGVLTVNGTGVSSIAGNLDMTSNTIINLATPTNGTDAATKQYVDDVAQGLNIHDSCNAATQTTLATISGGTITYNNGTAGVGATLTTTGSYTTIDGVTLADGMRILVKNEATTANNGIYVRTSATVLTRAADFNTPTEMEGGDFTFITAGTLYDNTGWVMTDPVTTVGTSPVTWVQFSGAGTYTAGTGLTLTGTTFSVNVAQTQITSVGTLTSLAVSGAVTASTLVSNVATGTAPFTVTSTTQVANLSVATAGSATTAGTVTTAAQGNITSVGTLTGLGVNGTVTAVNITANTGVFTGNANGISSVQAGNIVGTTLGATVVTSSLTTVGTLGSLTVTGNVSGGNLTTGGIVAATGNVTGANIVSSAYAISSVAIGISAAGTVQANATALTKGINVVSTVTAGQGVVLPTAIAGMRITVLNTSANTLLVYPAVNGIINAAAANVAYSSPAGAKLDFVSTSTTQWYTLNATYN